MPRFYFDVREGARFSPDSVGLELDSLDAAEQEAVRVAAEMSRNKLPKGNAHEVTVEVKNEHGQRVLTVTVAMMVYRVFPRPDLQMTRINLLTLGVLNSHNGMYGTVYPARLISSECLS